jgi:plasmid stabilization system protein ParE
MKLVWTAAALADLDDILAYTAENYPALLAPVELRIRAVVERIGRHPESARRLEQRSEVRVVPVLRYPFRIFYRVAAVEIEILHIHHTSRDPEVERI